MNEAEAPRHFVVVESDRFADDRDRFVLSRNSHLGPKYADRWYKRLMSSLEDLTGFPGPLSWAIDEEASTFYGREVRRMLYYGPTRRRTGTPVRILFTLLPPAADDPDGETAIFLLRLLHGSQLLFVPEETA